MSALLALQPAQVARYGRRPRGGRLGVDGDPRARKARDVSARAHRETPSEPR